MSETPNVLTPRQLAVAFLSERIRQVRASIDAHEAEARDPSDIFHSQIRVFLEQVAVELRRAAAHIERVDSSEEPE